MECYNNLICSMSHFQVGAKVQFSERIDTYDENISFQDMNISRPLMKVGVIHRWQNSTFLVGK